MRMHLRIINEEPMLIDSKITFKLWSRGVVITNSKTYRLVIYAVAAAKRLAHNLSIDITSATYCEPSNNYEQHLRIRQHYGV